MQPNSPCDVDEALEMETMASNLGPSTDSGSTPLSHYLPTVSSLWRLNLGNPPMTKLVLRGFVNTVPLVRYNC